MNMTFSAGSRGAAPTRMATLGVAGLYAVGLCVGALLLGGCHKPPAPADSPSPSASKAQPAAAAKDASEAPEAAEEGLRLSPDQVEKMGIVTTIAQSTSYTPEAAGYAVVMAHETLAQGAADLNTAVAVERQSRAALERIQRLAGTPGALPADAQESAGRQAAVDQAALLLARQRLSAVFGQNPPWNDRDTALLTALADGKIKLVRVTFPLGALEGAVPTSLRLAPIDGTRAGKKSWKATTLWDAPADANVPGRSFFALLKGSDAGEGERLLAWAPVGSPEAGVLIPEAATVISDNKYWCYLERKPGVFVRIEIDTRMPLADGYFMGKAVAAGEKIVTQSAGQLLARETNSGAAAD